MYTNIKVNHDTLDSCNYCFKNITAISVQVWPYEWPAPSQAYCLCAPEQHHPRDRHQSSGHEDHEKIYCPVQEENANYSQGVDWIHHWELCSSQRRIQV